MKLLILTHCYPPDGGQFIKVRADGLGATVLNMARPLGLSSFWKFLRKSIAQSRNHELMEAHWLYPAGLAALIAYKITGTPYRVYCHGTDVIMAERSWFWRMVAKSIAKNCKDKICFVSAFLARRAVVFLPASANVVIDPMPVDKTIFHNRGEERTFDVGYIVKKNTGRYREALRVVEDNPRSIQINFFEQKTQEQLATIFNHCKVVILASEKEGYGLILAEAAECGAQIIGVDDGGIPEVVAKYNGHIFDGTAADLKTKLTALLAA